MARELKDEGEEYYTLNLPQTITKLKTNGYQYCSAGDARRLIRRIEELEDSLGIVRT